MIEPDASHPLLDDARATGVRVMIGQPALRGCCCRSSPAAAAARCGGCTHCASDVAENEAVLAAAKTVLRRYRPDPEPPAAPGRAHRRSPARRPLARLRTSAGPAAVVRGRPQRARVDRVRPGSISSCAPGPGSVLLCGDSTLALAILRELARRAWERRELAEAAAIGRADRPGRRARLPLQQRAAAGPAGRGPAPRIPRHLARRPSPGPCAIDTEPRPVAGHAARHAGCDAAGRGAETAVVVADVPDERGMHEAGRVARLHPGTPVFVLTSDGAGTSGAIFDQLQPFQRALLVDGEVPEDTWTRVARHWHECYRLSHPPAPGDPRALTRRPWADLDDFIRQDNILQIRSIMTAVVARGRRWVPGRAVVPGSFIELSEHDLEAVARAEHTRWYRRRLAAGWSPEPSPTAARDGRIQTTAREQPCGPLGGASPGRAQPGRRLSPVTARPAGGRGFHADRAPGRAPGAADFRRIGTVRARRLHARRPGRAGPATNCSGDAGDWRVVDDAGDERTVRDRPSGTATRRWAGRSGGGPAPSAPGRSARPWCCGRWRAGRWPGPGTGWWKAAGERWPVSDIQFRRTYTAVAGE